MLKRTDPNRRPAPKTSRKTADVIGQIAALFFAIPLAGTAYTHGVNVFAVAAIGIFTLAATTPVFTDWARSAARVLNRRASKRS